jgi:hypothetical protein
MSTCGRVAVLGLCLLGLTAHVWASDISWTFQRIDAANPGMSPMVSLGMRTGATWPTVFYEPSGSPSSLVSSSLSPLGWTKTSMDTPGVPSFAHAAAGADGRLGAAWQAGQINPRIQFAQLTASGWQSSTVATLPGTPSSSGANAPDVAYLPGNRPVVAYSDMNGSKIKVAVQNAMGWESEAISYYPSGPSTGTYASTAVNGQGDIGVAYAYSSTVIYAQKALPGGTWNYVQLPGYSSVKNISLAYGPNDEVGMAVLSGNGTLNYAHFDVQSGQWQSDLLATGIVTSPRVDLVFDSAGRPSLAYVGYDGSPAVHYWRNDGGGWADSTLPVGTDANNLTITPIAGSDAALTLDRNGIPVISYYASGGLLLAYDPQITPEPATLLGVIAALGLISRRRRQA